MMLKRFFYVKGFNTEDGFVCRPVYYTAILFLAAALITFFAASCAPDNNEDDVLVPEDLNGTGEEQDLNAINVLTGEAVSFPGDWEGELIYLNFFMTT